MHIDRRQRRLPVMGVNDIGALRRQMAKGNAGPGQRQDRKPQPVVRMILAIGADIGAARAIEELWNFEDQEIETVDGRP
ncbi:hypothetical protein D3C87_2016460 [compost metagenome]